MTHSIPIILCQLCLLGCVSSAFANNNVAEERPALQTIENPIVASKQAKFRERDPYRKATCTLSAIKMPATHIVVSGGQGNTWRTCVFGAVDRRDHQTKNCIFAHFPLSLNSYICFGVAFLGSAQ